jgi:hypothetical protein
MSLTDQQRIEWFQEELRRVKIQRNDYEHELRQTKIELANVKAELALLENYVNRRKSNQ